MALGRSLLLALLALFALVSFAEACVTKYPIGCCITTKAYYKKGKIDHYECKKCEKGYKQTKNREQCVREGNAKCDVGFGPGPMGIGDDKCYKCSDQNCRDCHNVFYDCTRCKNGYLLSEGQCIPPLY